MTLAPEQLHGRLARRNTTVGTSPYDVVDGHVTIPAEPGWGVAIDPAWLAAATYQCSERR